MLNRRYFMCVFVPTLMALNSVCASAGTFRHDAYFNGTYLMGVESVEEMDYYTNLYPGIDEPIPTMIFHRNGTVDIGTESATYQTSRGGRTIVINYVPPPTSYFSTVQYVLHREDGDYYWGEILFDGYLYGIIQGQLTP
ncbi:MAG: hypothetical protein KDA85_02910 [Planctomycetaceae bacterium]|nr:hypothetical protein [Planctomycetaceae bacterium]